MAKTQGPSYTGSKIKRIRKSGFLARKSTSDGEKVIKRRISKGRVALTAHDEFASKMDKNKRFSRRR